MTRHMISFPIGEQRFNYRVAAVIVVDGHVLICDENDDGEPMCVPLPALCLSRHASLSLSLSPPTS